MSEEKKDYSSYYNLAIAFLVCAAVLYIRNQHHDHMERSEEVILHQVDQLENISQIVSGMPDGAAKVELQRALVPRWTFHSVKREEPSDSTETVEEEDEPEETTTAIVKAVTIVRDHNDAEQVGSKVYVNSDDLELGHFRGSDQVVGVRFVGPILPKGAKIHNAALRFEAKAITDGPLKLCIKTQKGQPPAEFRDLANDVSDRELSAKSVIWSPKNWTKIDEIHETPDLSVILQETLDDPRYDPGDAFVFVITPEPGQSFYRSAKSAQLGGPTLVVEYTVDK